MTDNDDSDTIGGEQILRRRFDQAHERATRWLKAEARDLKPGRRAILRDMVAGLPGAISSVPDGMAAGVLAGVNPTHGLYASLAGPLVGGVTTSTRMMIIATTGAASLAAGSAVAGSPGNERSAAVVLLTAMVAIILVIAAIVKLNRYIRLVSHSVMLGFLAGVSVNIVLSQVPDLVGVEAPGTIPLLKAGFVVTNLSNLSLASVVVGLVSLALLVLLGRTKWAVLGSIFALVLPTVAVHLLHLQPVSLVKDNGALPHGLPVPQLPDLTLFTGDLLGGAVAVAALVIIQGVGVAEAAPNRHGQPASIRRDVVAQGLANAGSALIGGMPVGGSVGQTALNKAAGAQTRWASIWTGVWMLAILLVFSSWVGEVAVPTLAAVLIYAGVASIRPSDLVSAVRAGLIPTIAIVTTFVAVLLLPIAPAVGIGVVASLALQLNQAGRDVRLTQLRADSRGRVVESPAPATVESGQILVLNPYGSLFFSGARTLQRRLPRPVRSESPGADGPVVILRLRGYTTLGATFLDVMSSYVKTLAATGGQLYLTGVQPELVKQWRVNDESSLVAGVSIRPATDEVGRGTREALAQATRRARRGDDVAHRVLPAAADHQL